VEAEDGIAGGYLAIGSSPDLIICGVEMPHMNGYDLVTALKADPATQHIPVIFLTVVDDVAEQARKLGAVAYLNKPIMADRLLEVVTLFASMQAAPLGSNPHASA
jgi:CheY-like chemotaxis protein